ncbi:MAG: hypothetical protein ACXWWC_01915 [Chitinophagaceae bacterium]
MELSISPEFEFLMNTKTRDVKKADCLRQMAEEENYLALIWKKIAEKVLANNMAEAKNNTDWLKLIEQPEWTIYSRHIPKSRLENFGECFSDVLGKGQTHHMNYMVFKIGYILQKRKLTKEIIEDDLKLIKEANFFNRNNRIHDDTTVSESISLMLSEAEAITAFSKQFISSLMKARAKQESQLFSSVSKFLFLKKITDDQLLNEFREKYVSVSGLNVSVDFLKKGTVYAAFNFKNRMCGGFVLGNVNPYRTIEVFAGEACKKKLYEFVQGTSFCELNCFWLSVKNRKGFWSYWFWLLFAFKVSMRKEKMLIYGTIAKSLANTYGYPKKSRLLHTEELMFDGKMRTSWIFTGARSHFFVGVLETFIYKLKNNNKKRVKHKRVKLPVAYTASAVPAN